MGDVYMVGSTTPLSKKEAEELARKGQVPQALFAVIMEEVNRRMGVLEGQVNVLKKKVRELTKKENKKRSE